MSKAVTPSDKAAPALVVAVMERWHRIECMIAVPCFAFIAGIFTSQRLAIHAMVVGSYAPCCSLSFCGNIAFWASRSISVLKL